MFSWKLGTEIVIFGASSGGKKIYNKYKGRYKILFFLDNDVKYEKSQDIIYGKKVYHTNQLRNSLKSYKILIASDYWENIANQLRDIGLKIYDNYLPYWAFEYKSIRVFELLKITHKSELNYILGKMRQNKKGAIIHGNCQTRIIQKYLQHSADFSNQYIFYDIPRVCEYNKAKILELINDDLWENCFLFITQNISIENKFGKELSTDYLTLKLPPQSKIVIISNLYFTGYFPQHIMNKRNVLTEINQSGYFPFGDSNIEEFIKDGCNANDIIRRISDVNFYSNEFISEYIEKQFAEIEKREQPCDVKMLDFIKNYYKEKLLFYSFNHPSQFVLKELAARILSYLNINNECGFSLEQYLDDEFSLKGQDEVVYPAVQKYLHLDLKKAYYYPNKFLDSMMILSFEDYARSYMEYCFDVF